jgi:hypothetical protein
MARRYHAELTGRGMDANEAAGLALRCAAGVSRLPPTLSDLVAALQRAREPGGEEIAPAAAMVRPYGLLLSALQRCCNTVLGGAIYCSNPPLMLVLMMSMRLPYRQYL